MTQVAHTLPKLRALAQSSPQEARAYLTQVARGLRQSGLGQAASAIDQLLEGDLVGRIEQNKAQLGLIFPDAGKDWAALQAQRAQSVGWTAGDQKVPLQQLRGTVSVEGGSLVLTTPGGRTFALAEAVKNSGFSPMPRHWMQGLIGDGPISVQGKLGKDGKTFNVESFALDTDGAFARFTFGRVRVVGDTVSVATPRGDVEVTDPALKAKLKQIPKLGVILPGLPSDVDGKLRYDGQPTELFVLAGFRGGAKPAGEGRATAIADMAFAAFDDKPVDFPAELVGRTGHTERVWLKGDFTVGEGGDVTGFVASYVSQATDGIGVQMASSVADADPVQAAVMLAE